MSIDLKQRVKRLIPPALRPLLARLRKLPVAPPPIAAKLVPAGARTGAANGANPDGKTAACGWTVADENRRGREVAGVTIRRYPYPYKCAIAINNDTDGFMHKPFEAFHDYVSGTGETKFGSGLGLEIADSFWIWAPGQYVSLYHHGPWQDKMAPSPEHERVLELARAGWLDTLHGVGAWNEEWLIDRERIARGIDYLASKDVALKVYVGHGGFNMAHNFGGPWGYYQHADNPEHKSYCLDLLQSYGFRYFWTDVMFELDKFGEDEIFATQAELDARVAGHDFQRYFWPNDPKDWQLAHEAFPGLDKAGTNAWKRKLFNKVLIPVTCRDGAKAFAFKRFRGHDGPQAGNFIVQVNPETLDHLEERHGATIVYQHFGTWRALFMGKKHVSQRNSRAEDVLDEHNLWAFRTLAERNHEGRVFVATSRRLLDYLWMRDYLYFSVESCGDKTLIRIEDVDCPVHGRVPATREVLNGLAFIVPRRQGDTKVLLEGRELPVVVAEDPARPQHVVVHLPWQKLEYPQ